MQASQIPKVIKPEVIQIKPQAKQILFRKSKSLRLKNRLPKQIQKPIRLTKIEKKIIKPEITKVLEKPVKKNLLQNVSINELMQNPAVVSLECKGPNIPLIMKTRAGPSEINKILSLEEINDIINKFSEESHIPIVSEVFRAIVNNMMITALLSNPEIPQFIITKLSGK